MFVVKTQDIWSFSSVCLYDSPPWGVSSTHISRPMCICVWREFWGQNTHPLLPHIQPCHMHVIQVSLSRLCSIFSQGESFTKTMRASAPIRFLVSPSTLQEPNSGSSDSDPLLPSPRSLSYSVLTHHRLTLPVRKIHWAWYFHGPLVCLHHLPHSLLYSSVNGYQINKTEMRLHGEPVAIHWKWIFWRAQRSSTYASRYWDGWRIRYLLRIKACERKEEKQDWPEEVELCCRPNNLQPSRWGVLEQILFIGIILYQAKNDQMVHPCLTSCRLIPERTSPQRK